MVTSTFSQSVDAAAARVTVRVRAAGLESPSPKKATEFTKKNMTK